MNDSSYEWEAYLNGLEVQAGMPRCQMPWWMQRRIDQQSDEKTTYGTASDEDEVERGDDLVSFGPTVCDEDDSDSISRLLEGLGEKSHSQADLSYGPDVALGRLQTDEEDTMLFDEEVSDEIQPGHQALGEISLVRYPYPCPSCLIPGPRICRHTDSLE